MKKTIKIMIFLMLIAVLSSFVVIADNDKGCSPACPNGQICFSGECQDKIPSANGDSNIHNEMVDDLAEYLGVDATDRQEFLKNLDNSKEYGNLVGHSTDDEKEVYYLLEGSQIPEKKTEDAKKVPQEGDPDFVGPIQPKEEDEKDSFWKKLLPDIKFGKKTSEDIGKTKTLQLQKTAENQAFWSSSIKGMSLTERFSRLNNLLQFLGTQSMGSEKITNQLKKWLGTEDADWSGWIADSELAKWVDYPQGKLCEDKATGLLILDENFNFINSGSHFPSFNGRGYAFVAGKRIVSDKCDWDTSFRVNGEKPCWIRQNDEEALGYLYTISFSFQHPYDEYDIEDMDKDEIEDKGMYKNGSILMRIIMHASGSGDSSLMKPEYQKGKIRVLNPGDVESDTVSFYSKKYFDRVYIDFDIDPTEFKYLGSDKIPDDPLNKKCTENDRNGCFIEIEQKGISGFGYIPDDAYTGETAEESYITVIDDNFGSTSFSSGDGSGSSSSGSSGGSTPSDDGDFGGII